MSNDSTRKSVCPKCGGKGVLPHFMHINNGVCYACNGSGEFKEVCQKTTRKGLTEIVSGHCVWQFSAHRNDFDGSLPREGPPNDLMIQAVSGSGRAGKTLFRIRLIGDADLVAGRKIFKAAKANIHPDEITNEFLGFTPGPCQVTRNQKGVSFL